MRLLSMLIGVSGASQHTFRSEATGRTAYNTTAVTFNGTGRVFPMSEEQDSDATANDGKNQQENKSSTDQQDEKKGKEVPSLVSRRKPSYQRTPIYGKRERHCGSP